MQRQRNASDVAIELRRQFGLPKDAPIVARIATLAALTPIFLLRHSVGVRLVGMPRLVILLLSMLVFGLVPSLILAESTAAADQLWRPMLMLTAVTVYAGLQHRFHRWTMRLKGEKLHSLSLGTSWLSYVIPKGNAERYADPAIAIVGGAVLIALDVAPALLIVSAWLILSGLSLYAIEKYVHELQLDQYDALLNAEAHEQVTALYLKGMSEHLQQVKPSTPLSTGVDADLATAIASRPRPHAIESVNRSEELSGEQASLFADELGGKPDTEAVHEPAAAHRYASTPLPDKTQETPKREAQSTGRETLTTIVLVAFVLLLFIYGQTVDKWLHLEPTVAPAPVTRASDPPPASQAIVNPPAQLAGGSQDDDNERERVATERRHMLSATRLAKAVPPDTLRGGFAWRVSREDGESAYIAVDAARAHARIGQLRQRAEAGNKEAQRDLGLVYAIGVYQAGTGVLLVPIDRQESDKWLQLGHSPS